ncbi:MAG: gas vesicle protein [Actinomycetota bacterium]|nr:gas vesicle protein [Actinomycetota bacterium]
MAERRGNNQGKASNDSKDSEDSKGSQGSNGANARRLSAREAVEYVREDFPALLGRPLESVLGVQRGEDSGWLVMVQVVELERIPRSTDVLGAYAVELDNEGELVGYRRQRRYNRGQPDQD